MKNIIFVPTIQSTGTWFCLELLKNHSFVRYCSPWATLDEEELSKNNLISVVQCHFGDDHPESPELASYGDGDMTEWLDKADKIVIPVRDPLLSLLTSYARGPELEHHRFIVNGFVKLVEICEKYEVFLLPVDIYSSRTELERYAILKDMFTYLRLPLEPFLAVFAMTWPVVNTVGERIGKRNKNMYYSRDIATISHVLGEDYNYLLSKKDILLPFLENLGYRELIWG